MAKQQSSQKQPTVTQTAIAAPMPFLQPRAFAEPNTAITENALQQPDLQAQIDQASTFGHSLGRINPCPLSTLPIQPKLTIGKVGDPYEQEADRVAAQVVQQINQPATTSGKASVQRQAIGEEDELQMKPDIQRRSDVGGMAASDNLESSINQARGGGQGLSDSIRQPMEQAFGADFSSVRVHTDSQSDQLSRSINAQAFTTKNDIFFSKGAYSPGDRGGQALLAHELTHVVQQGGAAVQRKATTPITQASPQISRSHTSTIQRLPMSMKDFDEKIKKHWPIKGNTLAGLRTKLDLFHKNLRFLPLNEQIFQLNQMKEIARGWQWNNYDFEKGKDIHPKTSDGLELLIESMDTEIAVLTDPKKKNQGISNQSDSGVKDEVKAIYTKNIYTPVCAAIAKKLGLGRREMFRSDQLNAFRKKLKDAARGQAYLDIDAVANEVMASEGKEESEAMQQYYATKAKVKAYTESKDFVNKVVKDLAGDITKAAVPEEATCYVLTQVAQQAAADYKDPTEAMVLKASALVKAQVGRTKGANAGEAIQTARDITKGSKTAETVKDLGAKIETDIQGGDHKFARTTLQTVIQSDTLDKGFQKLGKMVDLAVPSPGSSCEVDIQLKVPGPKGVYFTTRVLGAAEKDSEEGKQEVEAKLDVSMGGGWSALKVIDVNIQAGFFFKSKAATSQKVLQQVSYAFYRKLQTESKDSSLANWLWGMKGADKVTNSKGQKMTEGESAEIWAAAMEESLFYERDSTGKIVTEADPNDPTKKVKKRNESSVEVGWLVGGQLGLNAGGAAKVEGEAKYKRGIRYSAETLGDGLGKHDKTLAELKQAGAGQSRNTIQLKSEVEIKALGSGFGCGLEGSISFNSDGVYEFEVEGFAKANTQWGENKEAWQTALASIGTSAGGLIKKLANKANNEGAKLDRAVGVLADGGFTATDLGKFSESGETLGADLAGATPEVTDGVTGESGKALGVKQSFKLAVKYSMERTKTTDPFSQALEVSISRMRELGYEADMGSAGLKVKAETGEKLVQIKRGWGQEKKFGGHFLGMGKEYGQ